jgi:AraC-like DNA-binding protein
MQDNLSELLQTVRVEDACCIRAELTAPWGCRHDQSSGALFYICLNGSAYLEIIASKQVAVLQSGDCAILPHGSAHTLKDSLTSPVASRLPAPCADQPKGFPVIRGGGGGGMATLIVIDLRLDRVRARTLMRFLPDIVHVPGDNGMLPRWARPLAEAGHNELESPGPGSAAVRNRLTELMFIQAVRSAARKHDSETDNRMGKVRRSPQVFNAVRLIRADLAARWSVVELATRVGMSRSAFAAAFTREMEAPPMQYLSAQRMLRAAELLRTPDVAISEIAFMVGYDSEIAFARGFKRLHGQGPGAYRRGTRLEIITEPTIERGLRPQSAMENPRRGGMQRPRSGQAG